MQLLCTSPLAVRLGKCCESAVVPHDVSNLNACATRCCSQAALPRRFTCCWRLSGVLRSTAFAALIIIQPFSCASPSYNTQRSRKLRLSFQSRFIAELCSHQSPCNTCTPLSCAAHQHHLLHPTHAGALQGPTAAAAALATLHALPHQCCHAPHAAGPLRSAHSPAAAAEACQGCSNARRTSAALVIVHYSSAWSTRPGLGPPVLPHISPL